MRRMKKIYELSKQAEKDLTGIWQYTLETWSREQADKYIAGLLNAFSAIAEAPEKVGRSYEYVRAGYRKYPFERHIIFYKILPGGTPMIVRVLHERMDIDKHL